MLAKEHLRFLQETPQLESVPHGVASLGRHGKPLSVRNDFIEAESDINGETPAPVRGPEPMVFRLI